MLIYQSAVSCTVDVYPGVLRHLCIQIESLATPRSQIHTACLLNAHKIDVLPQSKTTMNHSVHRKMLFQNNVLNSG